jgi:hypothetical protein
MIQILPVLTLRVVHSALRRAASYNGYSPTGIAQGNDESTG